MSSGLEATADNGAHGAELNSESTITALASRLLSFPALPLPVVSPSIKPALQELERAFDAFNTELYDSALPRPIITIQTKGRMNAYGWFWCNRWRNGASLVPEINISAEYLARPIKDLFGTLIHEMVHLDNWHKGIKDCSANQYHNAKFKAGCEAIGLLVEKTAKHGWSKTSLSPELGELIDSLNIDPKAFEAFRRDDSKEKGKKGSKMKLWECQCGVKVRVAIKDFNGECLDCETRFVLQE